jgi:hypothetical protein
MTLIPFLDHPQHAGLKLKSCKISDNMLRYMGFTNLSDLALVQSGDNAIKSTAAMGDFTIIDQSDQNPLRAGLFAIDAIDHIKFRFLEQLDPNNNTVYVRHSPDDKGGFTTDISSINIMGRAFWKLCLI